MVVDFVCFCVHVCECVSVRVRLCVGATVCVCVSRPLWSPLIPNLTDLLQRQPLMCAESHSGILDAASIIFTSFFPHKEYIVSPPPRAMPGPSSRTGGCCVMSLFTIQVFIF